MKIGLDKNTNQRIQPQKGRASICQCCKVDLIPKCGQIKTHHWAHKKTINCDKWWESETEWHRNWKNCFPTDWQEVLKYDHENLEKHIADIYIPSKDLVIEFQNSPISMNELESRERFYKKMIWVLNAQDFIIELQPVESIYDKLKVCSDEFLRNFTNPNIKFPDYTIENLLYYMKEILQNTALHNFEQQTIKFEKLFEQEVDILIQAYRNGKVNYEGVSLVKIKQEFIQQITDIIKKKINKLTEKNESLDNENKYFYYIWTKKPIIWSHAKQSVFLDTGKELYWIKSDSIIKKFPRDTFITKYNKT